MLGLSLFIGLPAAALCIGRWDAGGFAVLGMATLLAIAGMYWSHWFD